MKKLLVIAALGLLYLLGCGDSLAEQLRDGDILFQTSWSEQYAHTGSDLIIEF